LLIALSTKKDGRKVFIITEQMVNRGTKH